MDSLEHILCKICSVIKLLKSIFRNLLESINTNGQFDTRNGEKVEISVSLDVLEQVLSDDGLPVPGETFYNYWLTNFLVSNT